MRVPIDQGYGLFKALPGFGLLPSRGLNLRKGSHIREGFERVRTFPHVLVKGVPGFGLLANSRQILAVSALPAKIHLAVHVEGIY